MKKYILYLLLIAVLVISAGCTNGADPDPGEPELITENILFYYGSEGNETFVSEERQITYPEGDDKYEAALIELIKGPENPAYVGNIPENTEVYGTIEQSRDLIVSLSDDFLSFGGSVAEIVAVGSIVNTLTQFDEIERVKILVEGEEYIGPSGEPRGFMRTFTQENDETDVILYFSNQQATAVVAETRTISVPPGATLEDTIIIVLAELIEGPQLPELEPTIPSEVGILSVFIEDEIAYIDFSEEMHTQHGGGAAGESMTINSLVNTVTEFAGIELVKLTVAGEPMNLEHAILVDPLPRNEDMIES